MFRATKTIALACLLATFGIVGCSSGGGNDDDDSDDMTPPPPPPPNTQSVAVTLDSKQVVGGSAEAGSATANLTINLDDDVITGTVTLTGVTATAVTLNAGFAGEVGEVIVTLTEDSASEWSLPASVAFTAADVTTLEEGGFYIEISTAAAPGGALRGQLLATNLEIYVATLSGSQIVPPVATAASATVGITLDTTTSEVVIHVTTTGLDDAIAGHIHQALAGLNGPVLIGFVQDPDDASHWLSEDASLDAAGLDALASGELYAVIHTPANQPGEVRGQIAPGGIEVLFTDLTGAAVEPPVTTANSGTAATTINADAMSISTHVNLIGLDDATEATINQAPEGQNGPQALALTRDANTMSLWSISDQALSESQYSALRNQGLYVNVASPAEADGELRGQLQPATSAPGAGTLTVASIVPAAAATVDELPADIVVTFSDTLLASSATSSDRVTLERAGGDASFGDGNETQLNATSITADGATLTIGLVGIASEDDVYRLTLDGSSATPITSDSGAILDGDGDGAAGGDFSANFTVTTPVAAPSFASIQDDILTPSCAFSGCHDAATARAGLVLAAGQAFGNLVDVASSEVPTLDRVEPGDPDNSYLVQKLEGAAGIVGGQMPLIGGPLDPALIQQVRDWIAAGATN